MRKLSTPLRRCPKFLPAFHSGQRRKGVDSFLIFQRTNAPVADRPRGAVKGGLFTMPAWSADGRSLASDQRVGEANSVWVVGHRQRDQMDQLGRLRAASPK